MLSSWVLGTAILLHLSSNTLVQSPGFKLDCREFKQYHKGMAKQERSHARRTMMKRGHSSYKRVNRKWILNSKWKKQESYS